MVIAVDTNLLVYAHRSGLPEHRRAQRAVEKACGNPKGWAIPVFCAAEFWAAVTHPSISVRPSRAEQALAFLAELCAAGAKVLYPRDGFMERLAQLASDLKIQGPRILDLQIALVSFEGGASEICSDEHRRRDPQSIINNGWSVFMPWIRVKELARKFLAMGARRMPQGRQARCGRRLCWKRWWTRSVFAEPAFGLPTGLGPTASRFLTRWDRLAHRT